MSANLLLIIASLTFLESIFYLGFEVYSLLEYFCFLDWLQWNKTLAFMRIIYFHNPSCGESINIGRHVDELPNQAMITMTRRPGTTTTYISFTAAYVVVHLLWIIASLALIRKAQSYKMQGRRKSRGVWCFWVTVSGTTLFLDVIAAAMFFADSFKTDTIDNLASYLGATISGFSGRQLEGTWIPSAIMAGIFARGAVGWIIHLICFVYIFANPPWRNSFPDEETPLEEVPKEPTVAMILPPPPPASIHLTSAGDISRQPSSLRPERRPTPMQDYDQVDTGPIRTMRQADVIVEVDDNRRINFPTSLLSIPQQLEQVLADSSRPWQHTVASLGPAAVTVEREHDRRPSVASSHTQTIADLADGGTTASPVTAPALGSQKAWSYYHFGSSSHRMRDQLPPDEELPPVPVPDYTLGPKKSIISLFRGGSSASASTTTTVSPVTEQQTNSSTPNWRANDVLY